MTPLSAPSLVACPQEGCANRVAPTAKTCPSCGVDLVAYFSDNLGGYDKSPAMQAFTHWHDNGNGTVTDTKRKLTWLRAPYGMSWQGTYFVGEPQQLKWLEATSRFGKGNVVNAYDKDNTNLDVSVLARNATKASGYKRGWDVVQFAGRNDWRLPTIAEYLHLTELQGIANGFRGADYYGCYFEVVFCRGSRHLARYSHDQLLSATGRHKGKTLLGIRLWHGVEWAYYPNRGVIDVGSDVDDRAHCFLLVSDA